MSYENCDAAYADGVYNIPAGHPSYAPKLDDANGPGNGVACENPDSTEGLTNLAAQEDPLPSATTTTTASPTALPVTGTGDGGVIVGTGAALLLVGCTAVIAVRRRYQGAHR